MATSVQPAPSAGTPSTEKKTAAAPAPSPPPKARTSYSIFPPIPAPLQRLFDLVPVVTYPANALPGEAYDKVSEGNDASEAVAEDNTGDTLFVFIDPADAPSGRPSFNPTCLKWQAYLRFEGVPVRLAASTNHAAPSGALPFLLPGGRRTSATQNQHQQRRRRSKPVASQDLEAYARRNGAGKGGEKEEKPALLNPRAPAYQALLDGSIRRAWLHAVYLEERGAKEGDKKDEEGNGQSASSIACRLYAEPTSSSLVVQTALAHQLRAAAAAEVFPGGTQTNTPGETARIYRDAAAAWAALATLLEEGGSNAKGGVTEKKMEEGERRNEDTKNAAEPPLQSPFFFGNAEPTLFDAAVFAYTNLLLEDDDENDNDASTDHSSARRFPWKDRTLPGMVRAHPRLVHHRNTILTRYWPAREQTTPNVGDSVTWVKV